MKKATELFEQSLECLREQYIDFRFFTERDIVWTVQTRLIELVKEHQLPYEIFHEHTLSLGKHIDLVVLNNDVVEIAAVFHYEPDHTRRDIRPAKFPVNFWSDVVKDIQRIQELVDNGQVRAAYLACIDEGNYFHKVHTRSEDVWAPSFVEEQSLRLHSEWQHWEQNTWVLYTRVQV